MNVEKKKCPNPLSIFNMILLYKILKLAMIKFLKLLNTKMFRNIIISNFLERKKCYILTINLVSLDNR